MSPRKLTLVSGSYYGGNTYLGVSVAQDRLDAISGVGSLLVGFTLQLSGYLVAIATTPARGRGWADAVTAAGLAAAAVVASLGLGTLYKRWRIKPTLVEMSHFDGNGNRTEQPRGDQLFGWGTRGLAIPAKDKETKVGYVERVFGVNDPIVPKDGGGYRPMTNQD